MDKMDKETVIKYAPFAVVAISLMFQWNLFVTPDQLEIKHREIVQYVSSTYLTKEQAKDLRTQLNEMQKKIDRIYEVVTSYNRRQ